MYIKDPQSNGWKLLCVENHLYIVVGLGDISLQKFQFHFFVEYFFILAVYQLSMPLTHPSLLLATPQSSLQA